MVMRNPEGTRDAYINGLILFDLPNRETKVGRNYVIADMRTIVHLRSRTRGNRTWATKRTIAVERELLPCMEPSFA